MAVARVDLICSRCGCEFKHSKKCYNRASADSYEEWAKDAIDLCPDCYSEKRKEEMRNAVVEHINTYGLTIININDELDDLQGTDRQITWANKIRLECIENLVTDLPLIDKKALIAVVKSHDTAKWWIENRDDLESYVNPLARIKALCDGKMGEEQYEMCYSDKLAPLEGDAAEVRTATELRVKFLNNFIYPKPPKRTAFDKLNKVVSAGWWIEAEPYANNLTEYARLMNEYIKSKENEND